VSEFESLETTRARAQRRGQAYKRRIENIIGMLEITFEQLSKDVPPQLAGTDSEAAGHIHNAAIELQAILDIVDWETGYLK
jgi:hypothetical protein